MVKKKSLSWLAMCLVASLVLASLAIPSEVLAASIPTLDPGLIEQAKRLTPSQRRALAKQYGVNLSDLGAGSISKTQKQDATGMALSPRQESVDEDLEFRDAKAEPEREEESLPRFGMRLFSSRDSMYDPPEGSRVPQNYILGPGDTLAVTLFGKTNAEYEATITPDNKLVIPGLGSLEVSGLSFLEAKKLASKFVSERTIGTEILVSMSSIKQISVLVVGEVKSPGSYNLSSLSNVIHALYLAGGPTDIGSFRNIKINRDGTGDRTVDLYSLLLSGEIKGKSRLLDGDVIFVPPVQRLVSLKGEVVRPAEYEAVETTTLADLILMAGGPTARAYGANITIKRFDSITGVPKIVQVSGFGSDLSLNHGDEITVSASSDEPGNAVKVSGSVVQPGAYEFREGYRVGDYLGSLRANYLMDSDLSVGLVVRKINDEQDIEVLSFSPVQAAKGELNSLNPMLRPNDELVVLPLPSLELLGYDQNPETLDLLSKPAEDLSIHQLEEEYKFDKRDKKSRGRALNMTSAGSLNMDKKDSGTDPYSFDLKGQDVGSLERDELLAPIVRKLKSQAQPGKPAAVVGIYGAVREPGEYPLLGNVDGLQSIIDLAGGIEDGAYLGSVEVRRLVTTADRAETRVLNIDLSLQSSFRPEPADEFRINYLPGWRERESVNISGEVQFPGEYVLTPGETIGSLILRAGGFTEQAFVEATRFRSATAKEQQRAAVERALLQARKAARSESLGSELEEGPLDLLDLTTFAVEVEGRIVIDLPRILAGDSSADISLQDGDEILVPKLSEVVFVVGDVLEPGNYRHVRGTTVEDYIDYAAGFTSTAKKKGVYVIFPNGKVQTLNSSKKLFSFNGRDIEVVAGTTIVVPPNLNYSKPLDFYTQVSSVVFQSMASIAAFLSISRNN